MTAGVPVGQTPCTRPLTPETVLALQGHRSYPCLSVLLTTRPGPVLDPEDVGRLSALFDEARARLAVERSAAAEAVAGVLDQMSSLDGPVQQAVALFVSTATVARVDLPVAVVDRTVVDPKFATRDLVRALHRTPRHVVLMLTADEAQLFDGAGDVLVPVRSTFPLTDPLHRPGEPARLTFLQTVDRALGAHLRVRPAPLVLVGHQPTLSSFRSTSRNILRLVGTIRRHQLDEPDAALRTQIRDALEQYLLSRRAEALELLSRRREQGRALSGMQEVWLGARWERPEMLLVEQGFFYPARVGEDGEPLYPAADPHAPDVIDDVVDELIELVLARGGWIALLEDATLPDGTGVALTLRAG